MIDIIEQLKILIFGSVESWNAYEIGTTIVEGQETTNWIYYLIKYSPHLIMLILLLGIFLIIFYMFFRLIKKSF